MNRFPLKQLFAPALLAGAFLASQLGSGCLYGAVTTGPGNNDAGVNTDGGSLVPGPDMAVDLQAEFESKVQPLLLSDCGACHAQAGGSFPGFLAATSTSTVFKTFLNFPGLVGVTPETSRILTKGPHANPTAYTAQGGYTPSAELQAHSIVISDFIKLFNQLGGKGTGAELDMGVKTRITPIAPSMNVLNTLDLGQLDPSFTGMTITFTPSLVGTTQIRLLDVKMKASSGMGVRVKSPVFARYAAADPKVTVDIDYSMLGADITAYMGSEITFGTGILIFAYKPGELLGLSFELIEQKMGSADMGPAVGNCKDLVAYNTLKPRLTTAQIGMNNSCSAGNCHGQSGGVGGFNLNGFATAANDASICAGVLINTNLATPNLSPIYKHVTDATGHAGGKLDAGQRVAYLTELTTFINAQK